MKIIGIFGWEQTDICIYLASILENMRYHILVIDNSREHKMNCCIPKPDVELQTVTYKDIDYQQNISSNEWKKAEYDFVIVDMGGYPKGEELDRCDELLLVTDCDYIRMQRTRMYMLQIQKPMGVIIRNFCKESLNETKIITELECENCFVMEHFLLPFDAADESSRILMQYEGYQSFCHISKEFEKMLFQISCMVAQTEYLQVFQGIKRAKKGECY